MMASEIKIASYNCRGIKSAKSLIADICESKRFDIICLQELWLLPSNINKVVASLHPDYTGFGISGVENENQKCVLKGRLKGGTAIIWNKSLSSIIQPLVKLKHTRVTSVSLQCNNQEKFVLSSVYMPFYDLRNLESASFVYREVLAHLDQIKELHKSFTQIVCGDLNCDVINQKHSEFRDILQQWLVSRSLKHSGDITVNADVVNYTRREENQNAVSSSWLDYFIFEHAANISECVNEQYATNNSDHIPISCKLRTQGFDEIDIDEKKENKPKLMWNKYSRLELDLFAAAMDQELSAISFPYEAMNCNEYLCSNDDHRRDIDTYYNEIVKSIEKAEKRILKRFKPGSQKSFWNDELRDLKQDCLDAHTIWKESGRPHVGDINENRIKTKTHL